MPTMRMRVLAAAAVMPLLAAAVPADASLTRLDDVSLLVVPDAPLRPAPRAALKEGMHEIDLLLVYTPLAAQRLGGDGALIAEAQRLVARANEFFVNSLMPVRYRAAAIERYAGTSETVDIPDNQQAMAADPVLRRYRDQVGGDLVVLLRSHDQPETFCGRSVGFNGGEQSDPPANVNAERDAFIAIAIAPDANGLGCGDIDHLFAHEVGHALGGGHQYSPLGGTGGLGVYWRTYAHAWTCGDAGGAPYYSIMYGGLGPEVDVDGDGEPEVPRIGNPRGDFFSNPDLLLGGQVCGQDGIPGTEITEANNARSMTEAAPYVAAYRGAAVKDAAAPASFGAGGALSLTTLLVLLAGMAGRRPPG